MVDVARFSSHHHLHCADPLCSLIGPLPSSSAGPRAHSQSHGEDWRIRTRVTRADSHLRMLRVLRCCLHVARFLVCGKPSTLAAFQPARFGGNGEGNITASYNEQPFHCTWNGRRDHPNCPRCQRYPDASSHTTRTHDHDKLIPVRQSRLTAPTGHRHPAPATRRPREEELQQPWLAAGYSKRSTDTLRYPWSKGRYAPAPQVTSI